MTKSRPNQISSPLQRRLIGTLFVAESLFSAAVIAAFTLMPIVAQELSGRDSMAGFPSTMLLIGQAAAAYPIGRLMDRWGRRTGLTLGYAIATIGGLLAALAIGWGAFIAFCLGAGLFGVGRAAGLQARFAAAEIQDSAHRARAIGLIVFAGTVGAVGGPLLAAPAQQAAARYGLNPQTGPFLMAGLFFYLALALTFVFLRPDPMVVARALPDADDPPAGDGMISTGAPAAEQSLAMIFRRPAVRLALSSMIVGQLVMTLIMVITPLYMARLDYGAQEIGWVIMAHTLGMFAFSGLTGWLIDRIGQTRVIVVGALMLCLSAVLAPLSTALAALMASLFVLGLGWNFCFIAGSSMLAGALSRGESGRAQGANDMMVALASGTGSFSTGALFGLGSIGLVSAVGLGISLLLLLSIGLWGRTLAPAPVAGD